MFVLPLARPSALVRRNSVPTFSTVVDRLFDDSYDRFFGGSRASDEARTPTMDVSESDGAYTIVLDVPGATREQLKVSVEGRRVSISSSVATETQTQPEGQAVATDAQPADRVLYRERSSSVYARTVVLPAEVDQAASQAKFENGVLTLTLAKKVPTGATQLSIA